jgi:surfeit locus 1 family protein
MVGHERVGPLPSTHAAVRSAKGRPVNARNWIVLLAALLTAAVTARLGVWQLDRADQKTTLQQARDDQGLLPPLAGPELAGDASAATGQWYRRAAVEGRWADEQTVYLDNRSMAGRVGFFVVTPLVLNDGRAVMVQRGWLPRDVRDRSRIAPHRTDRGTVKVDGRIAPTASRLYQLGDAASGVIRQNVDLATYAGEIRRPLLPLVIVQDRPDSGTDDGLARQWPEPASDVHKHYGYAFQWFGLCALVTVLYVWFQLIRPRRRARR